MRTTIKICTSPSNLPTFAKALCQLKVKTADVRLLVARGVPVPLNDTVTGFAALRWQSIGHGDAEVTF